MADCFVYDAVRTPRGRGKVGGSLHEVAPVNLAVTVLQALRDRNGLDTAMVDDVVLGCVEPVGDQGADIARIAALHAGFAETVAGVQVNRFCASGLEAVNQAAAQVMSGMADLGDHGRRSPQAEAHYTELKRQRGRLDGLYGTLTLHRGLAEMMLEVGRFYRTAAVVPDRQREAATLAVATETRCAYVWSKHEPTARSAGLPQPAIEALRAGRHDAPELSPEDRDAVAVALAALALESIPAELQERAIEIGRAHV